ncbi:hypothetical protein [Nocardia transvalensis]|uniref:hypothetical protein n=1 Tax=Nocardia transvalensis TaxID=37333 RepID=UPI001895D076|nr:hypothetical protein [Nocardia transvalensis]MBF6332887.1 hypothetical protein [Nocardia transvalensis]
MRGRTLAIAGAMASAATLFGSGIAAADPATTIPGDGLYRVGVDIQPGIYQAAGSDDPDHGCYWRRMRHIMQPGDYNDPNHYIIASDFTHTRPVRTLIKPTDVAFETTNCGAWVMVPPPPNTGSYGPGGIFGSEY